MVSFPSHTHELVVGFTWTWHAEHSGNNAPWWVLIATGALPQPHIVLDQQKLFASVRPHVRDGLWHGGTWVEDRAYGEQVIAITRADIAAGLEKTYTTTGSATNRANHTHEVTLSAADFAVIQSVGLAHLALGVTEPRRMSCASLPIVALERTLSAS